MPVNAGSVSSAPMMELTFRVYLARSVMVPATGLNMGSVAQWSLIPYVYQADICPLKDDVLFLQVGADNISTHVYHFYANTDVRPKDRIYVLSSARLAGPIGSWFEVTSVVQPTESIAFLRGYGRITDQPTGVSTPQAPAQ